jgi:hypothetical protein
LSLRYRNTDLFLNEILRADLNGDGVEDVLVGVWWHAGRRFILKGTPIALTRLGPDRPFTIAQGIDWR